MPFWKGAFESTSTASVQASDTRGRYLGEHFEALINSARGKPSTCLFGMVHSRALRQAQYKPQAPVVEAALLFGTVAFEIPSHPVGPLVRRSTFGNRCYPEQFGRLSTSLSHR